MTDPILKVEWCVVDALKKERAVRFVVYTINDGRFVFETRGEAETFIENWMAKEE